MAGERFSYCLPVLREQGLVPDTELAIFVVGSMARGWAHATSDLDIVVVSAKPLTDDRLFGQDIPLVPDSLGVVAFRHERRRWEVKFWLDTQVDQLFDKVSRAAFDGDRKVGDRLVPLEQLFLERLRTCVPLTGRDWVERRRAQLAGSAFDALVITVALAESDSQAEAAMGLLAAGDVHGAVVAVRDAFGYAVDAVLAAAGESSPHRKWRPRRFREAAPTLLSFDEYWSIETLRDYDPADPERWVRAVFATCKAIAADIEIR